MQLPPGELPFSVLALAGAGPLREGASPDERSGDRADVARSEGLPSSPSGDRDALALALREHRATLARSARLLCGNPADADDLLHDVYERALRARARSADHDNLRAWLHSILRNLFIDRCRHARRHPQPLPLEHVAAIELVEPPPDQSRAWSSVTTRQLHAALAALPAEFRLVFELHAFEGLRYDQIASRVGIAPSTVGTRLTRARRKLHTILLRQLPHDDEACRARGRRRHG